MKSGRREGTKRGDWEAVTSMTERQFGECMILEGTKTTREKKRGSDLQCQMLMISQQIGGIRINL